MKGMGNPVGRLILSEGDIVPSQISHSHPSLCHPVFARAMWRRITYPPG